VAILPARYVIPNPLPDMANPWLIVDIFRTGWGPGARTAKDRHLVGITDSKIRTPVEAYYVRERIFVRPVEQAYRHMTPKQLLGIYKRPDKYITLAWDKLDDEDLQALEPGTLMVATTYKGAAGGAYAVPMSLISAGGMVASVGVEFTRLHRQAAYLDNDGTVIAAWMKEKQFKAGAGLGVSAVVTTLPVFGFSAGRESEDTRIYRFKYPDQAALLSENLRRVEPQGLPQDLEVLASSRAATTTRGLLLSAFGLANFRSSSEKTLFEARVGDETLQSKIHSRSRQMTGRLFGEAGRRGYKAEGMLNPNRELSAVVSVDYFRRWATNGNLEEVNRFLEIFPRNGLVEYPESWNHWQGSLNVEGTITIGQAGFDKVFSGRPRGEICARYLEGLAGLLETVKSQGRPLRPNAESWCSMAMGPEGINPIRAVNTYYRPDDPNDTGSLLDAFYGTRQFIWNFEKTQTSYLKLKSEIEAAPQADIRKYGNLSPVLNGINSLFQPNPLPQVVMRALEAWMTEEDYHRQVKVKSSLRGIPGGLEAIADSMGNNGVAQAHAETDLRLLMRGTINQLMDALPFFEGVKNINVKRGPRP
jgi:hypothetical protein